MKLSELHKGEEATILKMETQEDLKRRLHSFGITRGTTLKIEACSMKKQTMEILVDGTLIGLRRDEANLIEVEKL